MPVVYVREMRVFVAQHRVPMPVFVGLVTWPRDCVLVLVVRVMNMAVTVLHRLVHMFMLVVFGEVQPNAPSHQSGSDPERRLGRFAE